MKTIETPIFISGGGLSFEQGDRGVTSMVKNLESGKEVKLQFPVSGEGRPAGILGGPLCR